MSEYDGDYRNPQVARRWAEEIRRRVRAYRAGESKTRPIKEVLDEVDRLLADAQPLHVLDSRRGG
jgi:hypothetical protein